MIIISGGQTGADQAGLYAAKKFNFETGGTAPAGYRTLAGPNPEILKYKFNLIEHQKANYLFRTEDNVKNSDATIRLALNFQSRGELCTLKAIKKYNKLHLDIDLSKLLDPFVVAQWLKTKNIQILNIAGNGDHLGNGKIFELTYKYLCNVFKEYIEL